MATKVESADLLLKLYDLRREEKMRQAREWIFMFNPTSADDYWKTMMDPQVGGYLRMVTSYWDMAASFVNHGAIDAEMFNDTVGEHIMVFAKVEPILALFFQRDRILAGELHTLGPDCRERLLLQRVEKFFQGPTKILPTAAEARSRSRLSCFRARFARELRPLRAPLGQASFGVLASSREFSRVLGSSRHCTLARKP